MSTVTLRPWQRAAFDRFRAGADPDFRAVATPGAGKTTFALTCARATLTDEQHRLVVVAPTSHLPSNSSCSSPNRWAAARHRDKVVPCERTRP